MDEKLGFFGGYLVVLFVFVFVEFGFDDESKF